MNTDEKLTHLICELNKIRIDLINEVYDNSYELEDVVHELAAMADDIKELANNQSEKKLNELAANYWYNIMEDHSEKSEYDKFLEGFKAGFNSKLQ